MADTGSSDPRGECRTLTGLEDVSAFQIAGEAGGSPDGSPYSDGTIEVEIAGREATAKSFDWSSSLPVVGIWVKGGSGGEGNWYDYAGFSDQPPGAGADHDRALHTTLNPSGAASLSHVTVCYGAPSSDTPDLTIDKRSDAQGVQRVGDRFGYEIVVTNVGGATAHGLEVTDELPAGLQVRTLVPDFDGGPCTVASSVVPGDRFQMSVTCRRTTLAAGASASIRFDVEVTDDARCGPMRNVATASADDEPHRLVDGKNVGAHVDEVACRPSISLEKTGPDLAHGGDEVTYRFTVTNDGEADLRDVDLRDDRCDTQVSRTADGDGDAVLSPGESWAYRCSRSIRAVDGDPARNSARVRATDGDTSVSDTSSHEVDVIHPAIDLRTSVSPPSGAVGETVTYSYVVTNSGDTPLLDVVVTDDVLGAIGTVAKIAPGGSATLDADYVLPSVGVQVVNVGTARATDALGARVSDTDDAFITIVAAGTDPDGDGTEGTPGGTAFTGTDVDHPATAAILLFTIGLASLVAGRRRSPA